MNKNTQEIFTPFEIKKGQIPKRIQLLPAGNIIKGKDGRTWTVTDIHELACVSNESMPIESIDENHSADLVAGKGGSSPAFGWFRNITVENNGELWADVEWTERGSNALQNKDYRYLSPVFSNDMNGNITVILRAALTNTPNLDMVSLNSENLKNTDNMDSQEIVIKKIIEELELKDGSSFDDILKAIKELKKADMNMNHTNIIELKQRADELEIQLNSMIGSAFFREGEILVNEAVKAGIITPANKSFYLSLCSTNEGLEKVKSIIKNSVPIVCNSSVLKGTPPKYTEDENEDTEFISSLGYTKEQWQKIKNFANKDN